MLNSLYKYKSLLLCAAVGLFFSCKDDYGQDPQGVYAENAIRIGGIDTDEMTVSSITSRATGVPAETQTWLIQPLKNGLDITYGLYNANPNHEDVAILKLSDKNNKGGNEYDKDGDLAIYTFKYRADRKAVVGDGNDAIWYNNGSHYFQGVHVPERIRYSSDVTEVEADGKAPGLVIDQYNDTETGTDAELGNYTLLSHYLGMPANYRLTATVERIMLPFRHRLARVVAFVLIDPELNTTLKGYKSDKKTVEGQEVFYEDPNNTSIRFCNVNVLQGVKDQAETGVDGGGHHILTPKWTQARKVIPHFDGERGSYSYKTLEQYDENFKFYTKETDGKSDDLYPTSTNWKAVHDASGHNGYKEVIYGKVPVYDIIVRPTYTNVDNVMYDEEGYTVESSTTKTNLANRTNQIDFELELANGLRYEKRFEFDLDANYQTVVYLRISREQVDYNSSGSDIWIEERSTDGWFGVDNQNGNTLSYAGSSWQRAYTYGSQVSENNTNPNDQNGVTDGHFYNANSSTEEQEKAQYFTKSYKDIWVKKFAQAYKGGAHHGDYFILRDNITIDAGALPADFVFTGHLDAQDKTITLTGTNEWKVSTIDPLSKLMQKKAGATGTGDDDFEDIPNKQLYWIKQIAQSKSGNATGIPAGEPIAFIMENTTPADITSDMLLFYKDSQGNFQIYTNRTFFKKTGSSLFAGLNGIYKTAQETNASIPANQWEANVHKETNKSTVWVPTAGYRAEVLNLQIAVGATLFKPEATVTGNVQNCYNLTAEGKEAVTYTPNIPQYK